MTENTDNLLYITYESAMARMERANKRNFIIIIILILALIATNAGWIIYESQFETVETPIEAEQSGADVNIIGSGDIQYGAESNDQNTDKTT